MNRIAELDALRGFALFGIVLGNVMWFSGVAVTPAAGGVLDAIVTLALSVLVDGKFYALFSLLFGASFALLLRRAEQGGRSAKSIVVARLGSLFLVGVVHATLVWFGDILSLYAVSAIPLYWLARRSDRTALAWALGLLAAPLGISVALFVVLPVDAAGLGYGPAEQLSGFSSGSYSQLLVANAAFLKQRWVLALASGRLPRLLGMFLLGVLLLRTRPTPSRRLRVVLWAIAGLSNVALGVLSIAAPAPLSLLGLVKDAITCVAVPSGCLAYASALWPWFGRHERVTEALGAAGRLSLTHYISQSLVLAAIFYGCGLGLWGRPGAAEAVALGAGVAVLQIAASSAWQRRFGLGPAERVLRAMDRYARRAKSTRRAS